ncbi:MAG: hypothetical protein H7Y11_09105, partial [Armatimonadetes bacterium]|nr:hypothetical protein [Anaerolineae bacterium]
TRLAFAPDGNYLAYYPFRLRLDPTTLKLSRFDSSTFRFGDELLAASNELKATMTPLRLITLDYNPDGSLLAAGSDDGRIYLYDTQDLTLLRTLETPTAVTANPQSILGTVFNPTGTLLMTTEKEEQQVIRFWGIPKR